MVQHEGIATDEAHMLPPGSSSPPALPPGSGGSGGSWGSDSRTGQRHESHGDHRWLRLFGLERAPVIIQWLGPFSLTVFVLWGAYLLAFELIDRLVPRPPTVLTQSVPVPIHIDRTDEIVKAIDQSRKATVDAIERMDENQQKRHEAQMKRLDDVYDLTLLRRNIGLLDIPPRLIDPVGWLAYQPYAGEVP